MASVLTKTYLRLCEDIPHFKKTTRKWMYNLMARFIRHDHWTFMNYGYAHIHPHENIPELDDHDESNRLSFQLYHHLASQVDLKGKTVLEIGSGRGGGASMINKYHQPDKLVGLDFSANAVKLCSRKHKSDRLSFVEGDAENLPFEKELFDAVINVESSHCYNSMARFLKEVKDVLKPGGHFLFTDFRDAEAMPELENTIHGTEMKIVSKKNITAHVLKALNEDHHRRLDDIRKSVPRFLVKQFSEFAGVRDSVIYNEFTNGKTVYFSYVMQKI
ncbi:MAG: class I SAM-dependent methyltransferase [Bacteroidales bacterium]